MFVEVGRKKNKSFEEIRDQFFSIYGKFALSERALKTLYEYERLPEYADSE